MLLLELLPAPLLVDLVDADGHLVLEDQVADPALLELALGVAEGGEVGLHFLAEELGELDQHLLRPLRVVEGGEPEPALAALHHAVDVLDLGADVVVLDLLPEPHRLEALLAPPLYVAQEVLGIHALPEGRYRQHRIHCVRAFSHQVQVHVEGLGNGDCLVERHDLLGVLLVDVQWLGCRRKRDLLNRSISFRMGWCIVLERQWQWRFVLHLLDAVDDAVPGLDDVYLLIEDGHLTGNQRTLILRNSAISL